MTSPDLPSLLLLLVASLLLGVRHATDPDHVVAVATIVARHRSFWRAASVGALWGLGHTLTVAIVGGAIIVLRVAIPPRVGLGLEFLVALMLIALGAFNLLDRRAHVHAPHGARPVLVGMVHGLAGSAAVALLVLATIEGTAQALGYLAVFGVGTIIGMLLITGAVALPSLYAAARVPAMERYLRLASGAVSLAFGLALAHRIGVIDGLFTSTPRWTPQ